MLLDNSSIFNSTVTITKGYLSLIIVITPISIANWMMKKRNTFISHRILVGIYTMLIGHTKFSFVSSTAIRWRFNGGFARVRDLIKRINVIIFEQAAFVRGSPFH